MALHDELSQDRRFSEPYTLQLSGVNEGRSSMRGSDCSSSLSLAQGLTLPLIYPGDPMSDIALSFRDGARDLLKSGVCLRSVMGSGPTDVEFLFRTRRPDDEYNVPGWACEVGLTESASPRHLYKLHFTLTLSFSCRGGFKISIGTSNSQKSLCGSAS
jgi:hypothetical protein